MERNISPQKNCLLFLICFILISSSLTLLFFLKNAAVKEIALDLKPQADGAIYQIEQNKVTGNRCIISGWIIEDETNLGYFNTQLLIKVDERYYEINTKFVKRTDVTQSINDGYNYDNSGFYCDFDMDKLPNSDLYQICFLYQSNEKCMLIETDEMVKID